jgi:hypothetical protein
MRNFKFLYIGVFIIVSALFCAETVGKIVALSGKAGIYKNGKWQIIKSKIKITAEDKIKLTPKAAIKIAYDKKGTKVYKYSKSKQIIIIKNELSGKTASASAASGKKFSGLMGKLSKGSANSMLAPSAVAGVRGDDVAEQKEKVSSEEIEWAE